MFGGLEFSYRQTYSARDWLSILRTPYPTQNLQRKHRTDSQTALTVIIILIIIIIIINNPKLQ